MSFPLVRNEEKQTVNELVEKLNSTIEFDPSIDFTIIKENDYDDVDTEWE